MLNAATPEGSIALILTPPGGGTVEMHAQGPGKAASACFSNLLNGVRKKSLLGIPSWRRVCPSGGGARVVAVDVRKTRRSQSACASWTMLCPGSASHTMTAINATATATDQSINAGWHLGKIITFPYCGVRDTIHT